jgi:hypothetical protein
LSLLTIAESELHAGFAKWISKWFAEWTALDENPPGPRGIVRPAPIQIAEAAIRRRTEAVDQCRLATQLLVVGYGSQTAIKTLSHINHAMFQGYLNFDVIERSSIFG